MDEVLLARIVVQVLAMLNIPPFAQPPKHVLILLSGASSGVAAGRDAVSRLARAGHTVTVVLTPSALALLGEDRVRAAGAHEVILPTTWADAPGLVQQADLVLVPMLSMNTAARLALGLLDNLVSTLVVGALLAGKPVIAIRDGADPDGNAGRVFGATGAAPALRARLQANLTALASYGVELVSEDEFAAAIDRHLAAVQKLPAPAVPGSNGAGPPALAARPSPPAATRNGAGWITEADLLTMAPGSALQLSPGGRLTPLARETAARLGIRVVHE